MLNLVNQSMDGIQYLVFCGCKDVDGTSLTGVATDQWVDFNEQTRVWYHQMGSQYKVLRSLIRSEKPDVLFIIGLYSVGYNLLPVLFCKAPTKIISVRGMLHRGALSQKAWKKKIYIAFLNCLNIQNKVWFHATDEMEEQYIKYQFGIRARIAVAGNYPAQLPQAPVLTKTVGALSMVSIALISPMKNHLMVLKALQHCKAIITYHICGAIKDKAYWDLCQQEIQRLPSNITVHFHGEVLPVQTIDYLQQAHLAILPSKSENFGHAIYEALSVGKPVITSFGTPWLNLEQSRAGLNVDPECNELQKAISLFADMDNEAYSKWCAGAAEYAAKAIDVGALRIQYEEMFKV